MSWEQRGVTIKKFLKYFILVFLFLFLVFASYFFIGKAPEPEKITWGVNFSQKHTQNLGLNWRETYLAILDDLGAKNIKLAVHWDLIEPESGEYNFSDLDWQLTEALKRNAKIILLIGIKTSRWPECHIPFWVSVLPRKIQQEKVLELVQQIILRYKENDSIFAWQIENEPFFPFGECPWIDKDFVRKEINLAKSLDSERPVIISDSGEWSWWVQAARLGDIVSTTIYRKAWFEIAGAYINYPLPPVFYWRKAQIIKKFFNKEVICGELQAEPWGKVVLYYSPLEEQKKTMNLDQFRKNIDFAKKTGLNTFYLWGTEWWYWMKTKQNQPEIWEEAKKLFKI